MGENIVQNEQGHHGLNSQPLFRQSQPGTLHHKSDPDIRHRFIIRAMPGNPDAIQQARGRPSQRSGRFAGS